MTAMSESAKKNLVAAGPFAVALTDAVVEHLKCHGLDRFAGFLHEACGKVEALRP
jgi:hypothetical protein